VLIEKTNRDMEPEVQKLYNEVTRLINEKEFEKAIACFDKLIEVDPVLIVAWLLFKGMLLLHLKNYEDAAKCFEEANLDIYYVLALPMGDENIKAVIGIMIGKGDSLFSQIITKHDAIAHKEKYKDLYIDSLMIMSKLHVGKDETTQGIAHYTSQEALKKLLLEKADSKFRLHSITLSNDPSEGRTLMDYLYGKGKHTFDDGDNVALAGSFTFNKDRLNQYRLYGKRDGREATGVSIVFRESFFEDGMKAPSKGLLQIAAEMAKTPAEEEDKAALFRCIYVDPETGQIIGIGHKEDYTFYRDGLDDKAIEAYHAMIQGRLKEVKEAMQKLREKAQELDPAIVGELLLDLRCLTKHVAFEEEQECRIVKVRNYRTDKEVLPNETYQQYRINYLPIRGHVREIYFAPRCENLFVFEAELEKIGIKTHRSTHPLA
jgi:tetratricopeptide (TPR) repeat protein